MPDKIKLEIGQELTIANVSVCERYLAGTYEYIKFGDGKVETSANAATVAKQLLAYGITAPATPGPIPDAIGFCWRIARKELPGKIHGVIDCNVVDDAGQNVHPIAFAQNPAAYLAVGKPPKGLSDREPPPEGDDFLDFPEAQSEYPEPPATAMRGLANAVTKPAPQPAPVKASPAVLAAAVAQVKQALRPDHAIERQKIVDHYGDALKAAKALHEATSGGDVDYAYDGSAIQATGFSIWKLWEAAGLTK